MDISIKKPLVQTIKEQCKVCFSCVRECPAKAIKISRGQAEVIVERCIGCGNCVRVCTQKAKNVLNSTGAVYDLLVSSRSVVAMIAPSFPAEFTDIPYRKLVAMVRALGFGRVTEVAFGADLVSAEYIELVNTSKSGHYIATTCPAVVNYVEKYHPDLVENLAPIASPMTAGARAVHALYGKEVTVVFIGPCIAKKSEAERGDVSHSVDEVLTFIELRKMFEEKNISADSVSDSDFDPPYPGKGTLYPIGRGMLQASGLNEDFMNTSVIATEGTKQFVQALRDFTAVKKDVVLLELLCCNGCIMGPGMTASQSHFSRRGSVSNYARTKHRAFDPGAWKREMERLSDLDLSVSFSANDMRLPMPTREELKKILENKGKFTPEDELNCGACGYETCIEHAIAIHRGLAESEMCIPHTIEILKKTAKELAESYGKLVETQQAMINSEKLASLGRLASGIAHEINNPLTGILTYSSLLFDDLKESEFGEDLEVIVKETTRCREIVKGLLNFARETKVEKKMANINDIINETLGILEKHMDFRNIKMVRVLSPDVPDSSLDVYQMKSVINNLAENAVHAMDGGGTLTFTTHYHAEKNLIELNVRDTGCGIARENLHKIFDPFYTTKQPGKGTGLGLAVIYGIIKKHNGVIDVDSKVGAGTEFMIRFPVTGMAPEPITG
ncbi:MAG TPA: [Fe-Fe] hydrogenase large subunit C-terminal domain-containing protein [Spirochaetota bacterium]|nr:[Fe-Fe] hydrogenase large subunit C-terminal domain-containing protein [Spirochaetota bacterium]